MQAGLAVRFRTKERIILMQSTCLLARRGAEVSFLFATIPFLVSKVNFGAEAFCLLAFRIITCPVVNLFSSDSFLSTTSTRAMFAHQLKFSTKTFHGNRVCLSKGIFMKMWSRRSLTFYRRNYPENVVRGFTLTSSE